MRSILSSISGTWLLKARIDLTICEHFWALWIAPLVIHSAGLAGTFQIRSISMNLKFEVQKQVFFETLASFAVSTDYFNLETSASHFVRSNSQRRTAFPATRKSA